MVTSSKGARERIFRLNPGSLPFLDREANAMGWINWPVLLSAAERVWHLAEELNATELEPEVVESEIALVMGPICERLAQARWLPALRAPESSEAFEKLGCIHAVLERITR